MAEPPRRVTPRGTGGPALVDLACRELVELVTDYLEGALTPGERARFEAHIAGCEGCTHYVAQIRATIAITGATRAHEEGPEIRGLLAAFRDRQRGRPPGG